MVTDHNLLEIFDFELFEIFLGIVALPIIMFATLTIISWGYRHSLARSMKQSVSGEKLDLSVPSQEPTTFVRKKLGIKLLDAADEHDKSPIVMNGIADASNITNKIQKIFLTAAIVYSTIAICSLTIAASTTEIPFDIVITVFYLLQINVIVIVIRVFHYKSRLKVVLLGGYMFVGTLLALYLAMYSSAIIIPVFSSILVMPIAGLLLLTSKKLEPILYMLVAIILFVVTATFFASPILSKAELSEISPIIYVLGAVNLILGIVVFWWLLQRHSVTGPIAVLCTFAAIGIVGVEFIGTDHYVTSIVSSIIFGLPFNVLQIFLIWSIFKLFIWMQNKKIISSEILRLHLCFSWLTGYFIILAVYGSSLFGNTIWLTWTLAGAFICYLVVFHTQLAQLRTKSILKSGKNLLFLRVFGSPDKREKLLNTLDDTWRRLGSINLITGIDLVSRSLKSIMLEAFLLRRVDDQFLKTSSEVDLRLKNIHYGIEGDLRYPLNSINCYTGSWKTAVMKLAKDADVILVDLRGFNRTNKGCIFEINYLIQNVSLRRFILLIDHATDMQALNDIALSSWKALSSSSPNVEDPNPELLILSYELRSKEGTNALLSLLLQASQIQKSHQSEASVKVH